MLTYLLALVVGLGSAALYLSAFLYPEIHRQRDFIWSGVGLFYALVLWFCAGRITGGVLLGQIAGVALTGWLAWQVLEARLKEASIAQGGTGDRSLPSASELQVKAKEIFNPDKILNPDSREQVLGQLKQGVSKVSDRVKAKVGNIGNKGSSAPSSSPPTAYQPLNREDFGNPPITVETAGATVQNPETAGQASAGSSSASRSSVSDVVGKVTAIGQSISQSVGGLLKKPPKNTATYVRKDYREADAPVSATPASVTPVADKPVPKDTDTETTAGGSSEVPEASIPEIAVPELSEETDSGDADSDGTDVADPVVTESIETPIVETPIVETPIVDIPATTSPAIQVSVSADPIEDVPDLVDAVSESTPEPVPEPSEEQAAENVLETISAAATTPELPESESQESVEDTAISALEDIQEEPFLEDVDESQDEDFSQDTEESQDVGESQDTEASQENSPESQQSRRNKKRKNRDRRNQATPPKPASQDSIATPPKPASQDSINAAQKRREPEDQLLYDASDPDEE